jgi:hypothetical protein
MTKISRPFQIALVAVVLLAAVYLVALRKHSSSSESSAPAPVASSATPSSASSGSSAPASASSSSAASPSSGAPGSTSTYKGSAPGVGGLTRAIQKARGAVSESEQNAKALQQKATAASGSAEKLGSSATGAAGSAAATGGTAAAKHSAASSTGSAVKAKSKTPATKTGATKTPSAVPVMQVRVEHELKHGDIAALLFWNPSGAVDNTVRRELQATARKLHGKLAINIARSSAVGSFGTFTRSVQVYGTPTILLINPAGKTASVTGLTDVFSLEQAVREVKHSK